MEPSAGPSSVRLRDLSAIKNADETSTPFFLDAQQSILGDSARSASPVPFGAGLRHDLRTEWQALAKEGDKALFCDALLRMADRQMAQGRPEIAARSYAWLAQHGEGEARFQAKRRLEAFSGDGGIGLRAESLLKSFSKEASDPATLLAMAAGGLVYRTTRLAAMSRLAGSAGCFGRGFGLKLASGAAGLALEAPAFTLIGRVGHGVDIFSPGLKDELLSSYLVLGGLKSVGSLSRLASGGMKNEAMKKGLGYAGMYGGIMLGHSLETAVGLRDWRRGGIEWVEGLATLLQFHVSGRMLGHFGGERYRYMEKELEYRAEQAAENSSIEHVLAANDGNYPSIEPAANGPHRVAEDAEMRMAAGAEHMPSESTETSQGRLRLMAIAEGGDDGDAGRNPLSGRRMGPVFRAEISEPRSDPSKKERMLRFIVDEVPCEILPAGVQSTMQGRQYTAVISYLGGDAASLVPRMQFTFLDAYGGPFGGKPLLIPRQNSDPKIFREGEVVVFAVAIPSTEKSDVGPMSSGRGWAFFPDPQGNLFRLKVFHIPERKGGVLPVNFAQRMEFVSGGKELGWFRIWVDNFRIDDVSPANLILQIGRPHWENLGFEWPHSPGQIAIPSRSIVAVDDANSLLEGYRRRLEKIPEIEPWNESDVIALGELIVQIEELARMMSKDVPWLEAFYERHGDRMILADLPQPPSIKGVTNSWHRAFGDNGGVYSLRSSRPDDFSLAVSGNGEAKKGLLMPPSSREHTVFGKRNDYRAQKLCDGKYRLRLQYHAGGRYQDIDINISPEAAQELGYTIKDDFLFFPQDPKSVDLQVHAVSPDPYPWIELKISDSESIKVQKDWKDRRHALLLEDGASYGVMVPKVETAVGDEVFLVRVEGVFIFDLLFKDSMGNERRVELNLDDEEALALGFELKRQGLLIPQNNYLLLKVSQENSPIPNLHSDTDPL